MSQFPYPSIDAPRRPYFDLIGACLTHKDKDVSWDEERRVPAYVVHMCEQLATMCSTKSGRHVTLRDVLRKDALAAGHVDYQAKLALYCHELEQGL